VAQLAQRARFELTHALARDAELGADVLERARAFAVEAEAEHEDALHARRELRDRLRQLAVTMLDRRALVRLRRGLVLDQVGEEALAVADGRVQADRIV